MLYVLYVLYVYVCVVCVVETGVLPRYKRQFLNHALKCHNQFIKTFLTIFENEFTTFYIVSLPGVNLQPVA